LIQGPDLIILKPDKQILIIQVKRTKQLDTTKAERTTDYNRFYCKRKPKVAEPLEGFSSGHRKCKEYFRACSGRVKRIVVYDGAENENYESKMESVEFISRWTSPDFFKNTGFNCWDQLDCD
jgi:hypothetical protein